MSKPADPIDDHIADLVNRGLVRPMEDLPTPTWTTLSAGDILEDIATAAEDIATPEPDDYVARLLGLHIPSPDEVYRITGIYPLPRRTRPLPESRSFLRDRYDQWAREAFAMPDPMLGAPERDPEDIARQVVNWTGWSFDVALEYVIRRRSEGRDPLDPLGLAATVRKLRGDA